MYQLIYISRAREYFDMLELGRMLFTFRERNRRLGITGLMTYSDGAFMQLLEGTKSRVEQMFWRICEDPRHEAVQLIRSGPVEERVFSDWSMAYADLGNLAEYRSLATLIAGSEDVATDRIHLLAGDVIDVVRERGLHLQSV